MGLKPTTPHRVLRGAAGACALTTRPHDPTIGTISLSNRSHCISTGRFNVIVITLCLNNARLAWLSSLRTAGFIELLEEKSVPRYMYSDTISILLNPNVYAGAHLILPLEKTKIFNFDVLTVSFQSWQYWSMASNAFCSSLGVSARTTVSFAYSSAKKYKVGTQYLHYSGAYL